jgi:hypothetical protein
MNKGGKVIVNKDYVVAWEFDKQEIQVTLIKNETTIGWLHDEIIEENPEY